MPSHNNFDTFAERLSNIATNWENLSPEKIHPEFAYKMMADIAIDRVKAIQPPLPERLTGIGVYHGARVLVQYCHIAALLGNREGYSKDELVRMLYQPTSFDQLAMIASQPNSIAGDLEATNGIAHNRDTSKALRPYLSNYEGTPDSGLTMPFLLGDIMHERQYLTQSDQERMCPAHKMGSLTKIYSQFVTICAKDPLLFDASLATDIDFSYK